MSQNPDAPRENTAEEKDFESGLDYGAFASEEPDFPDEHLKQEPTPTQAGEDAAGDSAPSPSADQPTTTVPPVRENLTRSLSEELAAARSASSAEKIDAASNASVDDTDSRGADQDASRDDAAPAGPVAPVPAPAADDQPTTVVPAAEGATTVIPTEHRTPSPAETQAAPGTAASPAPAADPASPAPVAAPAAGAPVRRDAGDESITDADIDEEVAKSKRGISRFLTVLIAIFTPVLLTVAAVRIVASPLFLYVTYWRPGFPADPGGFDLRERLLYGSYGTDYLLNLADSRYLSQLAPGGEALFTEAEVSHMTDVKLVMWYAMLIGVVLLALTLLFFLLLRAWRPGGFARGVFAGAWVTLGLIVAAAVLAILDWQRFFTEFHRLLFADGTWTFSADSALIRLYPEQFWIDAGIWIVALLVIFSLIALLATWPTKRRRARRAERLAEVHERRRAKLIEELNSTNG